MSRLNNPTPQFFDNAGNPLPGGKLFFYETGSTIFKDTYADSGMSIKNSNPLILDGSGRTPNVFLDGAYKVRLLDSNDVQIWERDPVTIATGSQWEPWDSTKLYGLGDIVQGSDLLFYQSDISNNKNNNPVSSPAQWTEVTFLTTPQSNLVQRVTDILGLINVNNPTTDNVYRVTGFFFNAPESNPRGGGDFVWQADLNKNLANGGTIIDPSNIGGWDGTQATLAATYYGASGQGSGVGTGCWVRSDTEHVSILFAGAVGGGVTNDTESVLEAVSAGGGSAYVPAGTYLVDDDTPIDSLFGEGVIKKSYGLIPVNRGEDKAKYAEVSQAVLSAINPRGWDTDGNYAYVVCQGTYNATDQGILDILDVRDKYNINKVSSINIGSVGITPRALSVYGNYVYAQSVGGILHIFDVTDKTNPTLVDTVTLNAGNREESLIVGDVLVIPKQTNDIDFYSLRNPISPELLTTLAATGSFYQPISADNKLWVLNHNDGTAANLLCVDVSDPRNPAQLSYTTIAPLKFSRRGVIKGKYLYAGGLDSTSRLNIIDISDATTPTVVYTDATEKGIGTEIIGNTLISDNKLFDVTDPSSPVLLTSIVDVVQRPLSVGNVVLGFGPGTGAQGPAGNDGNADPTLRSLRVSNWELNGLTVGGLLARRAFVDFLSVRNRMQAESLNLGSGGCASLGPISGARVSSRGVIENTKNEVEAVSSVIGDISSLKNLFEVSAENAHTSFELSYTLIDNQALASSAAHTIGKKSFSGYITLAAAYGARVTVGDAIAERSIGTSSVLTVTITSGAGAGDPVKIGVSCPQLNIANSRAEFRIKAICSAPVLKIDVL